MTDFNNNNLPHAENLNKVPANIMNSRAGQDLKSLTIKDRIVLDNYLAHPYLGIARAL